MNTDLAFIYIQASHSFLLSPLMKHLLVSHCQMRKKESNSKMFKLNFCFIKGNKKITKKFEPRTNEKSIISFCNGFQVSTLGATFCCLCKTFEIHLFSTATLYFCYIVLNRVNNTQHKKKILNNKIYLIRKKH